MSISSREFNERMSTLELRAEEIELRIDRLLHGGEYSKSGLKAARKDLLRVRGEVERITRLRFE